MSMVAPVGEDGATVKTAEPPAIRQKSADELIAEMKKIPLFMTDMDDLDDESNDMLEAIKAIAYEGTRAEVAANFRTQGNECVATKQWLDAREFYSKAVAALKGPRVPLGEDGQPSDVRVVEIDDEAEEKKERALEEACYANRALCNLEMSITSHMNRCYAPRLTMPSRRTENYGSCNRDCAAALRLNPRNIKAWYRAASACLALDKVEEALDACNSGLHFDSSNSALIALSTRIKKRQTRLAELEASRRERDERAAREKYTLKLALKNRNIATRETANPPDLEDAAISLQDPLSTDSLLSFPVILLYPLHAQSDFVKAFAEDENLKQHLDYILPTPWDEANEYTVQRVECYMETLSGGLIKVGKNLALKALLGSGKIEVVDGLVRVNVLPKERAAAWIEEFKNRKGGT